MTKTKSKRRVRLVGGAARRMMMEVPRTLNLQVVQDENNENEAGGQEKESATHAKAEA